MDIDGSYYCSKCMRTVDNDSQVCPYCGYDPVNVSISSQHLVEGTFLNDRYLLGAVIGAGGFGVTYAAWDENLSVPVAIKEYFPVKYAYRNAEESDELLPHKESRGLFALGLSRFRQEAQVLAQFQNVPGIVNINECFDENETAYIAMEFVHGVPLDEYVREHRPSPKKLLDIMLPAINALEIIHRQGINHRDIKPENLLVQEDGSIKLIDFGSAREVEHVTNLIVVSDGYAPLEQYDLKQPQGPWVDVYGISATIYHMLTGVMPEASISRAKNDTLKAPTKLGVKLKKYQEKALIAGLTVDPKKRIQSIAEFRALLYNMPLPEEVHRRKAFVRRFVAAAVMTMLLLAVVVVNFTCGFPLGEGLLYSLYPDGWHVVGTTSDARTFRYIIIPNFVSTIEDGAFLGCYRLEYISIPDSVSSIGDGAFYDCVCLSSITIPDGVTYIGDSLFSNCKDLERVILPETITGIGNYAFADCKRLRTITLPENVTSIGHSAFLNCETLRSITLSHGVTSIGMSAFEGCKSLGDITIPNSVTSIGMRAFKDCEFLYTISLSNSLSDISFQMFANCSSLRSITIPQSVASIGLEAFLDCYSLQNVILSDGLTCIEPHAFAHCSMLESIVLPSSVKVIGGGPFAGCAGNLVITVFPDSYAEQYCVKNKLNHISHP